MGDNFIFGYSSAFDNKFLDYTPSMTNPDSNFPASDLKLYEHLNRPCKSSAKTETRIKLDFGAAKTFTGGIMLNDVNFAHAHIEKSTNGTDWTLIQEIDIACDEEVWRYKGYWPFTLDNKQYLSVLIPAQDPVDGLNFFRASSIIVVNTKLELLQNPSYDYEKWAAEADPIINKFPSGGEEVISQGDDLITEIRFGFDVLIDAEMTSIKSLNRIRRDQLMVFFENNGNSYGAYIVRRKSAIEKAETHYQINKVKTIEFREVV